jgi:hypothetical protein
VPESFILAIVEIKGNYATTPRYIQQRFATKEPDFGVSGVNYNLRDLLEISKDPS